MKLRLESCQRQDQDSQHFDNACMWRTVKTTESCQGFRDSWQFLAFYKCLNLESQHSLKKPIEIASDNTTFLLIVETGFYV